MDKAQSAILVTLGWEYIWELENQEGFFPLLGSGVRGSAVLI